MNRKLDFLAKYDENLTIAQLKQAVVEEERKSAEKEQEEIQEIKKEFENTELGEDEMLRQALILLAKRNGV